MGKEIAGDEGDVNEDDEQDDRDVVAGLGVVPLHGELGAD